MNTKTICIRAKANATARGQWTEGHRDLPSRPFDSPPAT